MPNLPKNKKQAGFIDVFSAIVVAVLLVGTTVTTYLAQHRQDIRNFAWDDFMLRESDYGSSDTGRDEDKSPAVGPDERGNQEPPPPPSDNNPPPNSSGSPDDRDEKRDNPPAPQRSFCEEHPEVSECLPDQPPLVYPTSVPQPTQAPQQTYDICNDPAYYYDPGCGRTPPNNPEEAAKRAAEEEEAKQREIARQLALNTAREKRQEAIQKILDEEEARAAKVAARIAAEQAAKAAADAAAEEAARQAAARQEAERQAKIDERQQRRLAELEEKYFPQPTQIAAAQPTTAPQPTSSCDLSDYYCRHKDLYPTPIGWVPPTDVPLPTSGPQPTSVPLPTGALSATLNIVPSIQPVIPNPYQGGNTVTSNITINTSADINFPSTTTNTAEPADKYLVDPASGQIFLNPKYYNLNVSLPSQADVSRFVYNAPVSAIEGFQKGVVRSAQDLTYLGQNTTLKYTDPLAYGVVTLDALTLGHVQDLNTMTSNYVNTNIAANRAAAASGIDIPFYAPERLGVAAPLGMTVSADVTTVGQLLKPNITTFSSTWDKVAASVDTKMSGIGLNNYDPWLSEYADTTNQMLGQQAKLQQTLLHQKGTDFFVPQPSSAYLDKVNRVTGFVEKQIQEYGLDPADIQTRANLTSKAANLELNYNRDYLSASMNEACVNGNGVCIHYAGLAASSLEQQGIPAQVVVLTVPGLESHAVVGYGPEVVAGLEYPKRLIDPTTLNGLGTFTTAELNTTYVRQLEALMGNKIQPNMTLDGAWGRPILNQSHP